MNDRYDGYGDQYELIGYDEGGRPVYRPVPSQRSAPPEYGGYDPYGGPPPGPSGGPSGGAQAPGRSDPYGTGRQPPPAPYDSRAQPPGRGGYPPPPHRTAPQPTVPPQVPYDAYDAYDTGTHTGSYDTGTHTGPYGTGSYDTGSHDAGAYRTDSYDTSGAQGPYGPAGPAGPGRPGPGRDADDGYHTEQFSFVEDEDDNSEDVIDWLKFTESRTERREEARRRARSRMIALVVVLALALAGGVGYLWQAGKLPALPGSGGTDAAAGEQTGPQNRDVIVVHMHHTKGGGTSTALLVDNTTTKQGVTILLPNALALNGDEGPTTLGRSVDDDGSSGTRDSLDSLLGTQVQGTWRLDTPYLENLVDLVGNIDVTTDTAVPDPDAKKDTEKGPEEKGPEEKGKGTPEPLVAKGENQTLSGRMAVAYATYRAPGEPETAQLNRFGQVMQGVLRKMSSDRSAATVTVQTLAQILDPSLTDKDLGAFLAKLADHAKEGDYATKLLPVQPDGTLTEQATTGVVRKLLGGTVKPAEQGAAVRVGVKNATGAKKAAQAARVSLVNGGYTVLGGSAVTAQSSSLVSYSDEARKKDAVEVAKTLGLPESAVRKGTKATNTANADVTVVLGQDYDYAHSAP